MHQAHIVSRRSIQAACLASAASALSLPSAVWAQDVVAPNAAAASAATSAQAQRAVDEAGFGEIVVTARREAENLQNVPVSVQVVSGDAIQKLAITSPTELTKLAAGLKLNIDRPSDPVIVLRGVRWAAGSGTPAIPVYVNEIPFDPAQSLQSLYDIGQIEVLRGPQGTTRGAPSISGAITITTHRPDLNKIGGYVRGLYGSGGHRSIEGAVNIPVIEDKLAIRVAGNLERSDVNRVHSVNSTIDPRYLSKNLRVTARFEPTDTLSFTGMYQLRRQTTRYFNQVSGSGSPGFAALGIPANFNGPALTIGDRKSVQDFPNYVAGNVDLVTANASWDVLGQRLSYNFGRQINRSHADRNGQDFANVLPGFEPYQVSGPANGIPKFSIHELRLSSIRGEIPLFDYDVGYFLKRSGSILAVSSPVFQQGAFGAPGTLPGVVRSPVSRYILNADTAIGIGQRTESFYGNLQVHLGERTELSAGVRRIKDRVPVTLDVVTGAAAVVASPLSALGGLPCAGIPGVFVTGLVNSTYPGFCDFNIPAGIGNTSSAFNPTYKKTIYNISLSHKFTDDILVYATTGSSFRSGLPAIANDGLPSNRLIPRPETAKSYEIGVKTTVNRALRINADIFQINYKDQLTQFEGVPYFNTVSGNISSTSLAFYSNVDSRVRGVEVEIYAKPIRNLSISTNLSYAKIKSRGGEVPCNDPSRPITAANPINVCPSIKGQTLNSAPPFQITVNGEYLQPLGSVDGYFRFTLNGQDRNPNYGTSVRSTKGYALLDLFAGVASNEAGWELGVYSKNVFNKDTELTARPILNSLYAPFAAPTGYDLVNRTLPRELGVTLRYTFGSR
ncbi:TonB-dependent receptor [Sphingomonas solaris]|uniref:TonB-dependent receptor n=1 Tax=Alterirhizorhabdus solaris TaxID=2529389 RepID=UPI0013967818|nr:TonB-dependent receptor [Sphingomonas solaris]